MSAQSTLVSARSAVVDYGLQLVSEGLTKGTGGNVSVLVDDRVAINPSGIPYNEIEPADVPIVDTDGNHLEGDLEPSSETPMHTAIYRNRDNVGGIVHAHAPYATAFAMAGEEIPPSNYLVAYVGEKIPLVGWEQPGSEALGENVVSVLGEVNDACLLQNHGLIAVGEDLEAAFGNAVITELCAQTYYMAKGIGDPVVLSDEQLREMSDQFEQYKTLGK